MDNEIIVALATAPMQAAIAIIRLSGQGCIDLVEKVFSKELKNVKGYNQVYGYIVDKEENKLVDEVILSIFRSPRSYTGEDMVEINCHGGMFIVNNVIALLIKKGARMAQRGEFTKRAYFNGKIDLIQSEAIHDMITATSEDNALLALNSLKGNTSSLINQLLEDLLKIRTLIEVNIDYPEYDEASLTTKESLKKDLKELKEKMEEILKDGYVGKIIKEGVNVALVGKPNVGKSSLLNLLLNEDKAIVTEIAGTTRDVVEGRIILNGLTINLFDTAGIHESSDEIEKIGVNKSKEIIKKADLIILVLDNLRGMEKEDYELLELTKDKPRILALNKSEFMIYHPFPENVIRVSAFLKEIDSLKEAIVKEIGINTKDYQNKPMLSNTRQIGLLNKALSQLNEAIKANENDVSVDLIAIDLQDCYYTILDILGKRVQDDVVDSIFSHFCLGK